MRIKGLILAAGRWRGSILSSTAKRERAATGPRHSPRYNKPLGDLERDSPLVLEVVGQIDRSHPTLPISRSMAYLPSRAMLRRAVGSGLFMRLRCALGHQIASRSFTGSHRLLIRCMISRLPLHDSGEADGGVVDHPHAISLRASTGTHALLTLRTKSMSSGSAASVATRCVGTPETWHNSAISCSTVPLSVGNSSDSKSPGLRPLWVQVPLPAS